MVKSPIVYTWLFLSSMLRVTSAVTFRRSPVPANISARNLPPSQDPWYTAPSGYGNADPGDVLRVRDSPELSRSIANCSAAYNLLYRTTDSNDEPAWAVTTVLIPSGSAANAHGATSLLSYLVPYDSADVDDSPSYVLLDSEKIDPTNLLPTMLGEGWYLNVPDYEGPLASFTAGGQSGHATIDAVRAVLNSQELLGFGCHDVKYALWGYSGGALGSNWAAELQAQYAPEMDFAGVAMGGLTPNVTTVLRDVNNSPNSPLIVNGILGLTSQDTAARDYIVSQLKTSGPQNASTFFLGRTESTSITNQIFSNQDIFGYFVNRDAFLQEPVIQALINRDGIMGKHGVPSMPVFVYKAIGDEVSPVAETDELVESYCADGANILYQRNTVGSHEAEYVNGQPAALVFLRSIFIGSYPLAGQSAGCNTMDVTVDLTSS